MKLEHLQRVVSLINIDALFNLHKVKFSKMEILFRDIEVKEAIDRVNVFINVEAIFNKFHNKYTEEALVVMTKDEIRAFHMSIISNVINLAAHYRLFFAKNRIRSNIVFYMNEFSKYGEQNNSIHVSKYREKYVYSYTQNPNYELINGVMRSVLNAIETITDYLENIYFVSSDRVESSLIPLIMVEDKMIDGQLNFIVSTDPYDMQYVNKNFLVIAPMGDESRVLTANNVYEFFRDKGELKVEDKLPSYLLPFILSTCGDKRRSLEKVKGTSFNSIYKGINKLFKKLDIGEDEYVSFEELAVAIKEDPLNPSGNRTRVVKNYMCIDLDRQLSMVSPSQKTVIEQQLKDRFDSESLKLINKKHFQECPLQVVELNQYHPKKRNLF